MVKIRYLTAPIAPSITREEPHVIGAQDYIAGVQQPNDLYRDATSPTGFHLRLSRVTRLRVSALG